MDSSTREASHAGSWYSGESKCSVLFSIYITGSKLKSQLNGWLSSAQVDLTNVGLLKAVIGPYSLHELSNPIL